MVFLPMFQTVCPMAACWLLALPSTSTLFHDEQVGKPPRVFLLSQRAHGASCDNGFAR